MLNYILIFTLIFNDKLLKGEYLIKTGHVPSFLHKIVEMDNSVFPYNNLTVNISISKIEGTLLYIIDKNSNQLIVSLYEEVEEKIKIEFRKEEHYLSLLELCGCNQCRYRWINLTISINNFVNIQCNHLKIFQLKYGKEISINNAYPMFDSKNTNSAAIWLVNTPTHGDYYSNNDQLSGCISQITYNKKPLNMVIYGNGIQIGCPISCNKDVCNSGTCLEIFTGKPMCDCTYASKNGPFCNSSGYSFENASVQNHKEVYKFKVIKLTWQSESKEIFSLSNEKLSIVIKNNRKSIVFIYKSILERLTLTKEIPIRMSNNSIIFVTLGNKEVLIKSPQITTETIFVTTELNDIYFKSMILLNGTGNIDIVYKLHQSDYQWYPVDLSKFQKINISQILQKCNITREKKDHIVRDTIISIFSHTIISMLIISNIIMLIYILKFKRSAIQKRIKPDFLLATASCDRTLKKSKWKILQKQSNL